VYCGHEYPQATPAWGNEILTEHIRTCPKHPMRKAEADIALLRAALTALVGASESPELEQMEAAMRAMPAPAADKAASIDAIHALLATLPNNAPAEARRDSGGAGRDAAGRFAPACALHQTIYDHGGSRIWIETPDGRRDLLADTYTTADYAKAIRDFSEQWLKLKQNAGTESIQRGKKGD